MGIGLTFGAPILANNKILIGGGRSFFNISAPNKGVLIWGQSQAVGAGTGAAQNAIEAGLSSLYGNVKISRYSANNITTPIAFQDEPSEDLQPATVFVGANFPIDHAGIELKLGRLLDARDANKFRLILIAINGSGLEDEWLNPNFDSPSLWSKLITRIDAQLLVMNAHLELIVHLAGESDSGESPDQDDYQTNLNEAIVNRLRARYGPAKVLISQLSYNSQAGGSIDRVITGQYQFAAITTGVAIVNTNDFTFLADNVHMNDQGLINWATAGDTKYGQLLAGTWPPTNRAYLKVPGKTALGTSAQGTAPETPVRSVGDLLLAIYGGNGNTAIATPSGWTQVTNSPQHDAASAANARLHVYTRVATTSYNGTGTNDPADAFVTADVSGDGGKMSVVLNLGKSTGGVTVTAGSTAASGTAITFPGVTTTADRSLVLNIIALQYNATSLAQGSIASEANADLTTLEKEFDRFSTTSSSGIIVYSGVDTTAGAVAGTTATALNAGTMAMLTIGVAP